MTLTEQLVDEMPGQLAEVILKSHFTLVAQPGAIEPIDLDGAEGWTSPNPHPALSLMHWTTDNQATAAAALDDVIERFQAQGRGFDWMTGPLCDENGLLPLLEGRGFIGEPLQIAAMVKPIAPHAEDAQPEGVHIHKALDVNDSEIWRVMAKGFDIPDDVAAVFHHAYMTPSPLQRSDVYVATLDDSNKPVGVGYLSYIGKGSSVLLRVSCTLEGSRGQGVYKALVRARMYEAAQQGRTEVFVHAYSPGSQRCLGDLGFNSAGTLQLYRWRP